MNFYIPITYHILQTTDDHTQIVSPSFESRIHLDCMGAQISSVLAMNFLHIVTGEYLIDYTEGDQGTYELECTDVMVDLVDSE